MFILLIGALLGGGIGALIGAPKGAGGEGFAWGLILGPVGWIIIALKDGDRLPCPSCRERIHPEATRCPRCSAEVVRAKVPQIQCPRCSWYYNVDLTGCNHCGAAKPRAATS